MESDDIRRRLEPIAKKAAGDNGTEFQYAEIGGTKRNLTLRVFIDRPEGVTIEDCTNVSRALEAELDADDFIPGKYVLEVSSPGIERRLFSLADFERFAGKKARIKSRSEIDGQKNFVGTIVSVDDGSVIFEDRTSGTKTIPHAEIEKANLKFDLEEELRKR
jgi:ribosome maturation factor RimP